MKPQGEQRAMYERGKSDSCVVPTKSANEVRGAPRAEEQMEGRRLASSNSTQRNRVRAQHRIALQQALERVRQAATPVRHDWRQEPSAVIPPAGICAGGAG